MISAIIPVLNAAKKLPSTLASLHDGTAAGKLAEVIVVDGGSRDDSRRIAERSGARVLEGPAGRGVQLRLGATGAAAPWLFFRHSDTRPDPGWGQAMAPILLAPSQDRAAVIKLPQQAKFMTA